LISVGKGLFARSIYEAGDEIVHYRGDIITIQKYREREKEDTDYKRYSS
jgi:SET domain-containing protein